MEEGTAVSRTWHLTFASVSRIARHSSRTLAKLLICPKTCVDVRWNRLTVCWEESQCEATYIPLFPFEFIKMIAQTGIDTAASTVPPAESASTAIWWLVPLAIACLALTWYLRRLNTATSNQSDRKDSQKRPSSKARSVASVTSDEREAPKDKDTSRPIHASKSSSKKKKKGQSNNQQKGKKPNGKQDGTPVVLGNVAAAKSSSESLSSSAKSPLTSEIAPESASASSSPAAAVNSPIPAAPVAAIFEPLRNVVPPRRKMASPEPSTDDKKPQSAFEESVSRPASGGKFERMVPSTAYTRASASRWPASMTTPVERPVPVRTAESKAESKPVASVPASPHPAIPATKGLKSFVSKVKSSTSSDSNAEGSVTEEKNATEGVQ